MSGGPPLLGESGTYSVPVRKAEQSVASTLQQSLPRERTITGYRLDSEVDLSDKVRRVVPDFELLEWRQGWLKYSGRADASHEAFWADLHQAIHRGVRHYVTWLAYLRSPG